MTNTKSDYFENKKLYNPTQAARILGISPPTVIKLLASKGIKHIGYWGDSESRYYRLYRGIDLNGVFASEECAETT